MTIHDLKCETCKLNLVLSVYKTQRDEHLLSELQNNDVHNVCLAFADSGIAEIGTFKVSGCEMWLPRSEHEQKDRDYAEVNVYDSIFAP